MKKKHRPTMRAAERQNEAPLAPVSSYSYSASKRLRSAAAIAKSRGSFRSIGVPPIVQLALQVKSYHINKIFKSSMTKQNECSFITYNDLIEEVGKLRLSPLNF